MITKKQLGLFMIIGGLLADVSILVAGRFGAGAWQGIGRVELSALTGGLAIAILGYPLMRLGNVPVVRPGEPYYANTTGLATESVWLSSLVRVLSALTLVVFLMYLAVYITYAVDLFRWPYDYDQGESFELYDAVLHSQGEWPYRDASQFPFYASNYPPVFHLLNITLFPLFGATLLSGRVLSFLITLLTAAMIGVTVRRRTGGIFIPLISGLGYLASNFVYHVGPLCRQQLTMVFLETCAVYFIAQSTDPSRKHNTRALIAGLGLLFVAGFTKQLAIFSAVAIFGYLFLIKPLRAIKLGIVFGLVFGAVFFLINWATDGYWWINTITANVNEFLVPQLIGLTRTWFRIHPVYILAAFGMVVYELYFDHLSLYSLWFIAALGTGVMSGKWGAGEAYWITSLSAAIILSGFALGKLREWLDQKQPKLQWIKLAIPALLLIQASRMVHLPTSGPFWGPIAKLLNVQGISAYAEYPYYDAVGYSQVGHLMLPEDYEGGAKIMAYVNEAEGLIFSEEAAFTMLARKPVVTNPTQLLNLYNAGILDTSKMESMLAREEFDLVIMRAQFYPPPVLATIGQHYGLVEHVPMNGFNYIIMKPLGQPVE